MRSKYRLFMQQGRRGFVAAGGGKSPGEESCPGKVEEVNTDEWARLQDAQSLCFYSPKNEMYPEVRLFLLIPLSSLPCLISDLPTYHIEGSNGRHFRRKTDGHPRRKCTPLWTLICNGLACDAFLGIGSDIPQVDLVGQKFPLIINSSLTVNRWLPSTRISG